ncbi:hypothetical protein ABEX25_05345 [Paenibacillus thiaminolyticus]|uniref:hypothetical protein n=1 Tax=Paenibacillus thiaminolyticus TaxID=49283 RepID=UPI003D27EAA5
MKKTVGIRWMAAVLAAVTLLAACGQEQQPVPATEGAAPAPDGIPSTPGSASQSTPLDPGSTVGTVSEPAATPESPESPAAPQAEAQPDASAWLGTWRWVNADKYNSSTIEIKSVDERQMVFSLLAFHVTNMKTLDGSHGNIENGVAEMVGNEAVFTDVEDEDFELRLSLTDDHLTLTTNKTYIQFGAFVTVDGAYARWKPEPTNTDYLIVPGQSLGKISLGMTQDEVIQQLGKPTAEEENRMIYQSSEHEIILYVKEQTVRQIAFSSPAFSTAERVNTGNFADYGDFFTRSECQQRFLHLRDEWNEGGLAFFTFNSDAPEDNTEYRQRVCGYIYEGPQMDEEPLIGAEWKPVSP